MKSWALLLLIFLTSVLFYILNCSDLFYNPEDAPKSVSWIDIKTGLTDSFDVDDTCINKYIDSFPDYEQYAALVGDIIDSGGFNISWNSVRNADYYEIRILKKKITTSNWDKAVLVATVSAKPVSSRMFTSINKLQPSVKGSNCTGCEVCVVVCPNNAVTLMKRKAVIDLSKCTGCGKCYDACTFNAVTNSFLGKGYYFGVRGFSENGMGSEQIACTEYSYLLRYTCWKWKKNGDSKKQICGACGAGCFILNKEAEEEGCPVDAILYDSTGTMFDKKGMVYIDQNKCIYCGKCVRKCIISHLPDGITAGYYAIRREVISSAQQ